MQVPLEITFRDAPHSEAIKEHINEKVTKLEKFSSDLISCHVVLNHENKNQQTGTLYSVHIAMTLPGKELVSTHTSEENMYVAIRDAFNKIQRQLDKSVGK